MLRDVFAGDLARDRAAGVIDVAGPWRPDLILCDEVDFGAMVAAEALGVPHVVVLVIAAGGFIRPEVVAEPIDVLRAQHGLPPDPDLAEHGRHLVLSSFPPSFRTPDFPLPATTRLMRPVSLPPGPDDLAPDWLGELGGRPVVYFTLGTIFPLESGDLFARVLAGLRTLPVDVVVTVGRETDPSWLGPQPSHVHVERYVAQSLVLPRCSVVLSHGGSGSVIGALAHAVPVVVAPMGADQPLNASRCEALGRGAGGLGRLTG